MTEREERGREILAGVTMFFGVLPLLLLQVTLLEEVGMPKESLFFSTLFASALITIFLSLFADLPLVAFPQASLVSFFTVFLCGELGFAFGTALGVLFFGGILAFLASLFPGWNRIFRVFPANLRLSLSGTLGLLLVLRGLEVAGIFVPREGGRFILGDLSHPRVFLTLLGFLVGALAYGFRLKGATLFGVLLVSVLSFFKGLWSFGAGKGVSSYLPSLLFSSRIDFSVLRYGILNIVGVAVFFVFLESLGAVGACVVRLDDRGDRNLSKFHRGLLFGNLGTVVGTLFGVPGIAPAWESAIGMGEGGRRGLSGVFCGLYLFGSIFLVPYLSRLPAFLAAPALVLGGFFMVEPLGRLDFKDTVEGLAALLLLVVTLLTSSLATGLSFGILGYTVLGLFLRRKEVHPFFFFLSPLLVWWLLAQ
ncbi:MAG: hypothetical protein ACUVTO_04915 [Candidatus Caldatribacteriaceae bacterium]